MKKIFYLLISMSLLTSCKKFLEVIPTNSISPQGYFKTEEEAEIALAGVYDVLGKSGTYGRTLYFEIDVADDSFVALSALTQDLSLFNYNPSDTKVTDLWTYMYTGINRANTLLDNIARVQMDPVKRDAIEGQALFLRAYYYFLLTNYWGNIPMRLQATNSVTDNDLPFTPYKDVYHQIVSDMEKAADKVYSIGKYANAGRVTKEVVWGILARVNLKMAGAPLRDKSRYAEAKKWAEKVITGGKNSLNTDYRQVFINMCKGSYDLKESMWEVEFKRYNGTQYEEGALGSINGISAGPKPWGYSYGAKHTTKYYFDLFENTSQTINGVAHILSPDMRRDWSISPYYYSDNLKATYNATQIYNRMDAKWRREYESTEPKFNNSTTINFPLLRYADVLLMYAEADNEINGPQAVAIEYVNQVRRRAYGKLLAGNGVKYIQIDNGGTGFTEEPTATVVGGGGFGAEARAIVSQGKITNIMILNSGSGYTSQPTVVISGVGTGASATAVLDNRMTINADLKSPATDDVIYFREAIKKERGLELGYEGLRRFDLIRWNDYITVMKQVATNIKSTTTTSPASTYAYAARHGDNVSARDTLLAIPSREIEMNRKAKQNNGW
jgi:starch-binding outer membrane protein, SusD/RagB family